MNKLEEQLGIILEKSLNLAEQSGDFIIEQGGALLVEFYSWHTITAILGIVLCLFISLLIHLSLRFFLKQEEKTEIYVFELFQILPLMFLIGNIYDLVFVLTAPKLYLIEYFLK